MGSINGIQTAILVNAAGEPLYPDTGRSGVVATASFTPAAAAYGAGDIQDTAQELQFTFSEGGDAVPAGSAIRILSAITRIGISAVPSGQTSYLLPLYNVTPPSARADNAAWSLPAGDLSAYLGDVSLGTPLDRGDVLFVNAGFQDLDVRLIGSSLFAELVTVGAHTATAVARSVTLIGILL